MNNLQIFENEKFEKYGLRFNCLNEFLKFFPENAEFMGNIYMAEIGNNIKIGCSANPKQRLKTLNSNLNIYSNKEIGQIFVSTPHTNYRENEKILHKKFTRYRINGEMFDIEIKKVILRISELSFLDERKRIKKKSNLFLEFMKTQIFSLPKNKEEFYLDVNKNVKNENIECLINKLEKLKSIREEEKKLEKDIRENLNPILPVIERSKVNA